MRKLIMVGIVLFGAVGCGNTVGPFRDRATTRREIDDPRISISEQERRSRDRLAIQEDSPEVGPLDGTPRSGVWGVRPK